MRKLSFVVINRNNKPYLERCIAAIKRVDYPKKEIILVDDKSTDGSLNKLQPKPNKLIKNSRQGGVAFSRNAGIKEATGEIVFVIDSDIELIRLNPKKVIKLFDKNQKLAALSGHYYSEDRGNWNAILDFRRQQMYFKNKRSYLYNLEDSYTTFSGGFCALHKDRIDRIKHRGKRGLGGEDLLFQLRALNEDYSFAYLADMVSVHNHHRTFLEFLKKAKSEANGSVWVVSKAISLDLKFPAFSPVYSFPILLLLGLTLGSWPLLFLNFLPNLYLVFTEHNRGSLGLLFYNALSDLLKIYYAVANLFSKEFALRVKLGYFTKASYFSLLGKYYWLTRIYYAR